MMQFSSHLIHPGTETQVNVIPTLSHTTQDAIDSFDPDERQCYDLKDGVNLTFLPYKSGYRYELSNCLTNELIKHTIWECKCYPKYFSDYISKGIS